MTRRDALRLTSRSSARLLDAVDALEPGRVVEGRPVGLFCAAQVTSIGERRVDTRTWLFLPGERVSRVYPYGGVFEHWRCSGDTCGRCVVEVGRLSVTWDVGAVDEYRYDEAADGISLDGTVFRPARPMTAESLAGRWIDTSENVYAFAADRTFTFGVGTTPGLGGTFEVEGLALVLSYSDGDVIRRTLFAMSAPGAPGLVSVDSEVFARTSITP